MISTNLEPLVQHEHQKGPNPAKVAITLEVLQVPYAVKPWQFGDAPNGVKGPAFTKITPNGSSRGPEYRRHILGVWRGDKLPSKSVR